MNIVVHPTYIHAGYLNWLCDNYLIGGNGPATGCISSRKRSSGPAGVMLTCQRQDAQGSL